MASESQKLIRLVVGEDGAGQRLDVFLAARLPGASRATVQRLIAEGAVTVDGAARRAKDAVAVGQTVAVTPGTALAPTRLAPVPMPLKILYEDRHIVVLDKPAGVAVHPGAGDTGPTLVEGLLAHVGSLPAPPLPPRAGDDGGDEAVDPLARLRPGIVHRLDKDTSGVIVCALTEQAHAALAAQFRDKSGILREYVALLDGVMARAEVVHESYLCRDPRSRVRFASISPEEYRRRIALRPSAAKSCRWAKSVFRLEQVYGERLSLARIRLFTGRTHQIRVHAVDLDLPVVGDLVYHRRVELPQRFPEPLRRLVATVSRQLLHARLLGFRHPASGAAMRFEAEYPADFMEILRQLAPFSRAPDVPMT